MKKLDRKSLVELANNLLSPKGKGYTSEELNRQLFVFCASCPDPIAAMDIVIETPPPITAEELVERALSCQSRDIASVPERELELNHPLRSIVLEIN